mmetsp:Transcript_27996/g.82324  ORF Transcript_27996/g.82324 Transcript_27996/m.82324 type:complete len:223 (-) Transcript_27996:1964-2632(-)
MTTSRHQRNPPSQDGTASRDSCACIRSTAPRVALSPRPPSRPPLHWPPLWRCRPPSSYSCNQQRESVPPRHPPPPSPRPRPNRNLPSTSPQRRTAPPGPLPPEPPPPCSSGRVGERGNRGRGRRPSRARLVSGGNGGMTTGGGGTPESALGRYGPRVPRWFPRRHRRRPPRGGGSTAPRGTSSPLPRPSSSPCLHPARESNNPPPRTPPSIGAFRPRPEGWS